MAEPKMKDLCANCGMRYGRHQKAGDFCPVRGKQWTYRTTKFKKKRNRASTRMEGK